MRTKFYYQNVYPLKLVPTVNKLRNVCTLSGFVFSFSMMITTKLARILSTERRSTLDLVKIFCSTNSSGGRKFELFSEIQVALKENSQAQNERQSSYIDTHIEKVLDNNKHRVTDEQKDFFSQPQLAKFEHLLARDPPKISHWIKVS